jgi:ribosomal protein L40E
MFGGDNMALLNTLNDFAKNVGDKTSGTIEATKLATRIAAQRKEISDEQEKIGAYYYAKLTQEGGPDEEIKDSFDRIAEIQDNIEEMESRIAAIKAAAANPLDPGKKLCVSCGAVIPVKSKYCPECGAKNVIEEAETSEAPADEDAPEATEETAEEKTEE